jgi:hypothetical protein
LNEGRFVHTFKALCCLLEPGEDPATLLLPADRALGDVARAVRCTIERDQLSRTAFVRLIRDDGCHLQVQQEFVDPIGPILLVVSQGYRPRDRLAIPLIHHYFY